MPEELPEHIDQIEDFYKSAFSEDTEMPSPELWGKVAAKLESIPPVTNLYDWKNGLIRISVEALLISSLAYYVTRPVSDASYQLPQSNLEQIPVSETPKIIEQDLHVSTKLQASPKSAEKSSEVNKFSKTIEKTPEAITEETVIKEPEPKAQEIIIAPEVTPVEDVKKEAPVVKEKQDLYSKLKKNITDSSKSLFIEKKK